MKQTSCAITYLALHNLNFRCIPNVDEQELVRQRKATGRLNVQAQLLLTHLYMTAGLISTRKIRSGGMVTAYIRRSIIRISGKKVERFFHLEND